MVTKYIQNILATFSTIPGSLPPDAGIEYDGKRYVSNKQYLDYLQTLNVKPTEEFLGGEIENTVNRRNLNLAYVQGLNDRSFWARVFPVAHRYRQLGIDAKEYTDAAQQTLEQVAKVNQQNKLARAGIVGGATVLGGIGYGLGHAVTNDQSKQFSYMGDIANFTVIEDLIQGINDLNLSEDKIINEDIYNTLKTGKIGLQHRIDSYFPDIEYVPDEEHMMLRNSPYPRRSFPEPTYVKRLVDSPAIYRHYEQDIAEIPYGQIVAPAFKNITDSRLRTLQAWQDANLDPKKIDVPQRIYDYASQIKLPTVSFPTLDIPNLPHIPYPHIDLSNVNIPNPLPLARDTIEAGAKLAEAGARTAYNVATNPVTLPPPATIGGVAAVQIAKAAAIQRELKKRQILKNEAVKNYIQAVNQLSTANKNTASLLPKGAMAITAAPVLGAGLGMTQNYLANQQE